MSLSIEIKELTYDEANYFAHGGIYVVCASRAIETGLASVVSVYPVVNRLLNERFSCCCFLSVTVIP